MRDSYQYIDGNQLTEEQLLFVARRDIKIPVEFDDQYIYDDERLLKRVELLKTMQKPYFFQVVFDDKKIVGFHIVSNMNHLTRKVANTLTLWVDPIYRRKGIAKQLKNNGIEWAIQQGYPSIQTHVNIKNNRMLEINKRFGFSCDMFLLKKDLTANEVLELKRKEHYLPTFYTDRLILKAPVMEDAKSYQHYFANYEVIKNLSTAVSWPYPDNGAYEYLKNIVIPMQGQERWTWGIYLKSNPLELIGCVDLFKRLERGNRGFWLGQKFWNQGIMTEAVKPIVDYAFLQLGFKKLIFENALGNIGSRKVKEKSGATFVGLKSSPHVDPNLNQSEQWELLREHWLKDSRPSFIANYKDLQDKDNVSYPNSKELLAIGSPVGKKLGLKKFGIHIETLSPGRRTSWPHAESEEEEFAYVIKGTPQVWLNGFVCNLKEGDFIAIPAGTGIAHTFINNSKKDVLLLVGGDSKILTNKVIYPKHPIRNLEMKNKGALWESCPTSELGSHSGLPDGVDSES